jgi:hypothetical protein
LIKSRVLYIISRKEDGNITKRELKDSAIEAGIIHVDEKRITAMRRAEEEYSDQAAYMSDRLIAKLEVYNRD